MSPFTGKHAAADCEGKSNPTLTLLLRIINRTFRRLGHHPYLINPGLSYQSHNLHYIPIRNFLVGSQKNSLPIEPVASNGGQLGFQFAGLHQIVVDIDFLILSNRDDQPFIIRRNGRR